MQAVDSSWIDWDREEEHLSFYIKHFPDDWLPKAGLGFVQFDKGLCFPLRGNLPPDATLMILDSIEERLRFRDKLEASGIDYYSARMVLPVQRFFHRTRISGFTVVGASDLRTELEKQAPSSR